MRIVLFGRRVVFSPIPVDINIGKELPAVQVQEGNPQKIILCALVEGIYVRPHATLGRKAFGLHVCSPLHKLRKH